MGRSKAELDWHGSTLLYRAAALLGRGGPVVVVAAAGQGLPELPPGVRVVRDPVPELGPLQGIGAGLAAAAELADRAFVAAVDMPFLHPVFVARVLRALTGDVEVALPHARGHRQPLAAAYRTTLAPRVAELLAAGLVRPGMLFERSAVAVLHDDDLLADPSVARLDPDLDSLTNINTFDDYLAARARVPAPVRVDGRSVTAATLGAALTPLPATVSLNGTPVDADPRLPLVAGDRVTITVAARPRTTARDAATDRRPR